MKKLIQFIFDFNQEHLLMKTLISVLPEYNNYCQHNFIQASPLNTTRHTLDYKQNLFSQIHFIWHYMMHTL